MVNVQKLEAFPLYSIKAVENADCLLIEFISRKIKDMAEGMRSLRSLEKVGQNPKNSSEWCHQHTTL